MQIESNQGLAGRFNISKCSMMSDLFIFIINFDSVLLTFLEKLMIYVNLPLSLILVLHVIQINLILQRGV